MIRTLTDSAAFQILANALQAADLRQTVYANNIANLQTPGYRREDVQFESALQQALNSGTATGSVGQSPLPIRSSGLNFGAGTAVQPHVVETSTVVDNNGNNVDVDAEMSAIAKNQLKYETLVQDIQDRFSRMKTAINGG